WPAPRREDAAPNGTGGRVAEYRRVGDRLSKKYPSVDVDPVLDLVIRESRIVEPVPIPADACSDKDDLKFLACALASNAACVVSGDRAILRASGYEGIEVMTPRQFQTRFLDRMPESPKMKADDMERARD
ncbi:MAG: PIN domain-containing protein, partial [Myxococcales bacterium]|nr:PIN domain-containing protein [Myxococcales bacterium]